MTPRLARLLTRLYPRAWRDRYGAEFEELLEMSSSDLRTTANIVCMALREHVVPAKDKIDQRTYSFAGIIKEPIAYLPLWMSVTAMAFVLSKIAGDFVTYGVVVRDRDEGAVAHMWQLLMCAQVPVLAFFAIKWLPRAPLKTVNVLALQAGAVLANFAVVFLAGLG
jgi:hypothetical protein